MENNHYLKKETGLGTILTIIYINGEKFHIRNNDGQIVDNGIQFIIYDKLNDEIVDAVIFDALNDYLIVRNN